MVTYGGSNQFQPASPTEKAAAQARLLAAQRENQATQEQRQQAPSAIKTGTPEEAAVRAEAQKIEQQRMVEEHVSRVGSSNDRFAQAREAAIKSGSFSYGSFGTPVPNSFVTSQGQRMERPVLPMTQGGGRISFGTPVSGTPISQMRTAVMPQTTEKTSQPTTVLKSGPSPVIRATQANLDKTNALRASQGLPPLEKVTTVQVVPSTKTTQSETGVTTLFGKTFKTFTPTSEKQTGEASSFLKVPFSGQKAQGGEVPSTSLADVFAFVPIGSLEKGAISAGKEISSFFTKAFAKEAPKAAETGAKVGTSDIGLNVPKYTDKFRTEKNIQSMINEKMKSPPPEMARQGKEVTPTPEITVKLGVGPGKVVSSNKGGTGILEGTGRPPTTPTEKTVSAGKGLEQIVREKQVTKTVQKQKPEFEQKQLSKQEQFLKDQEKAKTEQTGKTEEKLKAKQEQSLIERTGLRYIKDPGKPRQEQKQTPVPPVPILKPRPTTGEKPKPFPTLVPPVPITTTKQSQKQDQGGIGITDLLTVTKIPGNPSPPPPKPTPPPTKTPPTGETTTDKKRPPDLGVLGVGGGGGLVGKVSKGGFRREFVGNVPEASIIGTYKRSELSYSQRTISKSESEQSKQSTGRFVQSKRSRIL